MADAGRPVRVTRRNFAILQAKENPVLAHKSVLSKNTTTTRATLGEISNRTSVLPNNTDKKLGGASKGNFNVNPFLQNNASKENPAFEKPKGLAVKSNQSNVMINKTATNVAVKPPSKKPMAGVLNRVSSLVHSKPGLSVQDVNKTKASLSVIPSGSSKAILKPKQAEAVPKLLSSKVTVKKEVKPEVIIEPSVPKSDGFSTEQLVKLEAIDSQDKNDPQSVTDYVQEIYEYLKELEAMYCVPQDYIKQCKQMTCHMRGLLVDWLVEVHRSFKLMPETLYLAVSVFDRYMPLALDTNKQNLQLVGITCLLIAAKYEEILCPTVSDCTYITENTYTKKQVMDMEMKILDALKFNVGRPLPLHFLRRYTKVSNATYKDHGLAKYFLELMLVRHEMCHVAPSLQAAAAICLSLWLSEENKDQSIKCVWNYSLQYFSGYSWNEVEETLKTLVVVAVKGHQSKLSTVRRKFATKGHMQVSCCVEAALPRIKALFP